jgi:biopolymer transport protein TolR
VPYIDVMLVLLIIFMATPVSNPGIINLPTAAKSNMPPTEYVQVVLKADSSATIGVQGGEGNGKQERAISRAELVRKLGNLHDANPQMPVMISADKDIKYDEVITVISEAKKLGVERVGLATRQ